MQTRVLMLHPVSILKQKIPSLASLWESKSLDNVQRSAISFLWRRVVMLFAVEKAMCVASERCLRNPRSSKAHDISRLAFSIWEQMLYSKASLASRTSERRCWVPALHSVAGPVWLHCAHRSLLDSMVLWKGPTRPSVYPLHLSRHWYSMYAFYGWVSKWLAGRWVNGNTVIFSIKRENL